jgi:hypothetical protein
VPAFIQAKKTGDVHILTDFSRLNTQIKRKPFPFPLPKISDLLRKLSGFKYATAIDQRMGYYHIPLDLEAHKLCTTIFPWGKYQPNIQVYLDDILIFEEHAAIMEKFLERPQQAIFRANLRKCYFGESII